MKFLLVFLTCWCVGFIFLSLLLLHMWPKKRPKAFIFSTCSSITLMFHLFYFHTIDDFAFDVLIHLPESSCCINLFSPSIPSSVRHISVQPIWFDAVPVIKVESPCGWLWLFWQSGFVASIRRVMVSSSDRPSGGDGHLVMEGDSHQTEEATTFRSW